MVEFVLIRLAEIRDEAAQEEYDQNNPCQASLRRRVRYLRIKAMLAWRWAIATPAALKCRRWAVDAYAWLSAQYSACVLASTRRLGLPLPRAIGASLSIKELLRELELRGEDPAACVERVDLVNALCGPPPPPPPQRPHARSFEESWHEDRDDNV